VLHGSLQSLRRCSSQQAAEETEDGK